MGDRNCIKYSSPYNYTFSCCHDKDVKDMILKTEYIKKAGKTKLDHNTILGKVISIKTKSVFIPLHKHILHEKELIRDNQERHNKFKTLNALPY
jgi:hypothetical protein